jgi:hypothetical protein
MTGHGDIYSFEKLRPLHFQGSRFTYDGEVVRLKRRPTFTPQEDLLMKPRLQREPHLTVQCVFV